MSSNDLSKAMQAAEATLWPAASAYVGERPGKGGEFVRVSTGGDRGGRVEVDLTGTRQCGHCCGCRAMSARNATNAAESERVATGAFSLGSGERCDVSDTLKEDTTSSDSACTGACTGKQKDLSNATPLEALAAVIRRLSAEDRAKLAELLSSSQHDE